MFSWSRERKRSFDLAKKASQAIYGQSAGMVILRVSKSANSIRYHVTSNDSHSGDLLIKLIRRPLVEGHLGPQMTSRPSVSRRFQQEFRTLAPPWLCIPEVLYSDDSAGVLGMEYVDGINFKSILSRPEPPANFDLAHVGELAGRALAVWHSYLNFREKPESMGTRRGDDRVISFLDYSVWNIRIRSDMRNLALLDFPGAEVMELAHRDLASFLHSLLVVKHHPIARLGGSGWWNWREAYSAFLRGYSSESGLALTTRDFGLIANYLVSAIRRESRQYRRLIVHPRKAFEGVWYSLLKKHPALDPRALSDVYSGARGRSG